MEQDIISRVIIKAQQKQDLTPEEQALYLMHIRGLKEHEIVNKPVIILSNSNASFISDKKLHIFFADDDSDDIEFFIEVVHEASREIKVTIAKDGIEVLELLKLAVPDMIFLDLNMPRMGGIDCLKKIREKKQFDKVPVIIYSTNAEREDIDQTYLFKANKYIVKPTNYRNIQKQLNYTLSLSMDDLIPQLSREQYVLSF